MSNLWNPCKSYKKYNHIEFLEIYIYIYIYIYPYKCYKNLTIFRNAAKSITSKQMVANLENLVNAAKLLKSYWMLTNHWNSAKLI